MNLKKTTTAAIITIGLALLCAACKEKAAAPAQNPAQPPSTKAQPAPTSPPAKKQASKKEKKKQNPPAPVVSPAQRKAYFKALAAGRKLARQKKWSKAQKQFELCLKAIPMDSRALSELGWAAFQAGDYGRAGKANRDSVLAATEDRIKAASLYNLGRVAEARKKAGKAMGYYSRSLALRPHKGVAKRLAEVAASAGSAAPERVSPVAPQMDLVPCAEVFADMDALCKCLAREYMDAYGFNPEEQEAPECAKDGRSVSRAQVLTVSDELERMVEHYLVADQPGGKVQALARLATVYNPGAFGIYEQAEYLKFEEEQLGGRWLLRSVVRHNRSDRDLGIAEEEGRQVDSATICLVPEDDKQPVRCPLQIPLLDSYERVRMDDEELPGIEIDNELQTKGLPISRKVLLDMKLSAEGKAKVTLKEGGATPQIRAMLGEHKLW